MRTLQEHTEELLDTLYEDKEDLFGTAQESGELAHVVTLLNALFRDAVQSQASDIHIEPAEHVLRIRFRIDGILYQREDEDKRIAGALIQRLKLHAELDIAEKRLPQDGRFHFKLKNKTFDVRVATIPTAYGESLVMRLLDQSAPITDLSALGLDAEMVESIEQIYSKSQGMFLVTGPTGSGKTTTLYSILKRLNTSERKILTVEDPIEYKLDRLNQIQVNTKIELTFARILRAMLRQDPDVILVGEIRDAQTAQIALRAAITGHLVLATLHTNDAWTAALRLLDIGAEGYMVAAAIKGIIGQRLVRMICPHCAIATKLDEQQSIWLESMQVDTRLLFKHSLGCPECNNRGYKGRVGVYELLLLNKAMLDALRKNDTQAFVLSVLACKTYRPLSESVLNLLKKGQTSVHEAMRVLGRLDEDLLSRAGQTHAL